MEKLRKFGMMGADVLLSTLALPFVILYAVTSWYSTNLDKHMEL